MVSFHYRLRALITPPCLRLPFTDTSLTQYLLTLQHVENAFFAQGLDTFADSDFADAGYPTWVRNRISQIADHEAAHVADMTDALGADAPAACTYNLCASPSPSSFHTKTDR